MEMQGEAKVLRIFISSTDKFRHTPLYEVIVYAAKRYGLSGATVLKGIMGYGSTSSVISMKLWETSEKLPLIVEIIDKSEKVEQFFQTIKPYFEKIKYGCIVTLEKADILYFKTGRKRLDNK
jgi:uncharacterized protein